MRQQEGTSERQQTAPAARRPPHRAGRAAEGAAWGLQRAGDLRVERLLGERQKAARGVRGLGVRGTLLDGDVAQVGIRAPSGGYASLFCGEEAKRRVLQRYVAIDAVERMLRAA